MNLDNIMKNEFGKIVISAILGLGLASLFKKVCVDDNCLIIKSPPNIKNQVFGHDNKCYKYTPEVTKCSSKKVRFNPKVNVREIVY